MSLVPFDCQFLDFSFPFSISKSFASNRAFKASFSFISIATLPFSISSSKPAILAFSSAISAGRECDPDQWNSYAGRLKGTKEDVKTFNAYLDDLQSKVYEAHKILSAFDVPITAETLKNKLLGKSEKSKMLTGVFEEDHAPNVELAAVLPFLAMNSSEMTFESIVMAEPV